MTVIWRRACLFWLSMLPLLVLIYKAATNHLGSDPAQAIVIFLGTWTFNFLLLTLAVSPLKKFTHQSWLMKHRRMLGLFCLFYALAHMCAYCIFILGLDFSSIENEVLKRPYILMTLPAIILLIILGATSSQHMMRKLGNSWAKIHRSIYLIAILAWLHVLLQIRSNYTDAILYGALTSVLLSVRFFSKKRKHMGTAN